MTKKFKQGAGAGRFNNIIDDVSVLKSQSGRKSYSGNFGVVRCFLLTDTSAEPMVATGVAWNGAAWAQNGLGAAVDVYPNPNFTNDDYQDDMYIFARNFGGRWISIDPASAGGGTIRNAFVKTTPADVQTVLCWLSDTDNSGDEITVYCNVIGGTALNSAFPRLADGERIAVFNDGTYWRCCATFQASEEC